MEDNDRRRFLKRGGLTLSAWWGTQSPLALRAAGKDSANERVRVGIMGVGGRGSRLTQMFAANTQVEVVALADVDARRLPRAAESVAKLQGHRPRTTKDFRHIIDDPSIDVLVNGGPDHWHAIPTILACAAGKDVYVEKPDSHNIVEGLRMIAAMRKYNRVVQMGSQHRSTERIKTAQEFIRTGALGRCLVAKGWESARQGSIGFPPDTDPPPEVDYDMWLGSAPKRPFNPNRFHGRWRWFYDYGTGDLGNDGVHRLDMALAGLEAACESQADEPIGLPRAISASGGKWYFNDMQEFPDTLQVTYEFGDKTPKILTYEMRIWAPYRMDQESEGSAVYGDEGYIILGNSGWRAFGRNNKPIKEFRGGSDATPHVQNFIDCIKSRKKPNCDLQTIGHRASVLCHAGNISACLGRKLTLDPDTEMFRDDPEANALRGRSEWRAPWTLPDV